LLTIIDGKTQADEFYFHRISNRTTSTDGECRMKTKIELRVLELLCSRLCHNLISLVMAVNNGIELLADDEGEMSSDIRELLTLSAGSAAARLQYYRIAYGLGGQNAAPIGLS
jgi:hypothetical protein